MDNLKMMVAAAALQFVEEDMVLGVGTGSTVNYLIAELKKIRHKIDACVASSKATEALLREAHFPVVDLNAVNGIDLYIDGADEVNAEGVMIKGGGGALTREKIVATAAKQFICIVDESKVIKRLGEFPVAVEVLPMARSMVAREIVKLGGDPQYREGFLTDNGNIILDVYNLEINTPIALEEQFKLMTGVVDSGLFAKRVADKVLVGTDHGVDQLK